MEHAPKGIAVVTGATGGTGRAFAAAFAREGWPLILCDLHSEPLEALASALDVREPIAVLAGDVSDTGYPARVLAELAGRKIGALVHAAGVALSMADGKRVFDINFTATRALVEILPPCMAPSGVAILIASNSGQMFARPMIDRVVSNLLAGKTGTVARLMLRSPRGSEDHPPGP